MCCLSFSLYFSIRCPGLVGVLSRLRFLEGGTEGERRKEEDAWAPSHQPRPWSRVGGLLGHSACIENHCAYGLESDASLTSHTHFCCGEAQCTLAPFFGVFPFIPGVLELHRDSLLPFIVLGARWGLGLECMLLMWGVFLCPFCRNFPFPAF